ncbi:MAG: sigma 54-interacting transcriptional regulator [Planctomycetota bacterium]
MQYRSLFDRSPVPMLVLDAETWRPVEFNDGAASYMGYTRREFSGLTISDFEMTPAPDETAAHVDRILEAGHDSFTALHRARSGAPRDVRVDVTTVEWLGRPSMLTAWHDLGAGGGRGGTLRVDSAAVARASGVIAASAPMRRVVRLAERAASTALPVLLLGESGTGKEVIATHIHAASGRAERAFMPINCGALPPEIVDGELFGVEAGAFTGATRRRRGRLEEASGGTVFFDEIADLPLSQQVRLLRVLDGGEIHTVGSTRPTLVDLRVIAATNRDLRAMVEAGTFREDLYYRLAGVVIEIPPLRSRPEDVAPLVGAELSRLRRSEGRPIGSFSGEDMASLCAMPWRGNVRELLAVVRRAVALSPGGRPSLRDLGAPIAMGADAGAAVSSAGGLRLDDAIRAHLERVLTGCGWVIEGQDGAAARLGVPPSTLRSQMKRLGVRRS